MTNQTAATTQAPGTYRYRLMAVANGKEIVRELSREEAVELATLAQEDWNVTGAEWAAHYEGHGDIEISPLASILIEKK